MLASGSLDGRVKLWEVSTGRLLRNLIRHVGGTRAIAIDRVPRLIASAGGDGEVRLSDVRTGGLLSTLQVDMAGVHDVALSGDGQVVASASESGAVHVQFDFAPTPVPDSGRGGYEILFGPYQPYWAMGSGTTQPNEAWQLLDFFGSQDHQRALYQFDNHFLPALPQASYADLLTPRAKKMIDFSSTTSRRGPDPTNRNPFAAESRPRCDTGGLHLRRLESAGG